MQQLDEKDEKLDEFHDPEIVDWKRVRAAIEHENTLTNYRLIWFLTSQGFLFSAFAAVFQALVKSNAPSATQNFELIVTALIWMIPILGICVCVYLWVHLHAAQTQHNELHKWWIKKYGEKTGFDNKGYPRKHPTICGDKFGGKVMTSITKKLAPHFFPLIFALGWFVILFRDYLYSLLT